MYFSYRLARSAKRRSYLFAITIFILAVSLFSTVPDFPPLYILTYILFFPLSFPFYTLLEFTRIFVNDLPKHVTYRGVRFLTVDITVKSSLEYDIYSLHGLITAFSLFLLVNILGALLGYWIGKKHRIQRGDWWKALFGFAGSACLGVTFILWRALGYDVAVVLLGFGIIFFEIVYLSFIVDRISIMAERAHTQKEGNRCARKKAR